ncbi:hypothetical protein CSB45_11525 [candidate division KSB3 bacterium]|uniref:Uncharacterized protein n=1 Tax=candidate division KSB3 bacterium TaxID=2044937 RepID=A0A2G6E325_9BACT|nr:MAG: hypothetical protein CSB45_11525 [candidate division KSB3 bacterium]PIE28942.1 MAG: hypothetical protein CSA57_11575 [candidate division KSB3 bacterium]
MVIMIKRGSLQRLWKSKAIQHETLSGLVNRFLVIPFLKFGIGKSVTEKTAHSFDNISKVAKKYHEEGFSVIIIPSHPMARRHTLGMMYHCMKISRDISGSFPHVVLATDEITFVYITVRTINRLMQYLYRLIGKWGGHIMLNRNDPNSSFRAGIEIARLLRDQSIVVMAGEGYPRHDSRKYVDIPNSAESFYTKLKHKNLLAPESDKVTFVSDLTREIQALIDREDRQAYRSGKLADHVVESIWKLLYKRIPDGESLAIHDIIDELLLSWGERFGCLQGIDPVLGITVQPHYKTLILPVVFTEYGVKRLHIDVRDFFSIDNVSYTEVKRSLRDMETIQHHNLALEMYGDQEYHRLRVIQDICDFTHIAYQPRHNLFEDYHAGLLPFQEMSAALKEKQASARNASEAQRSESYHEYLYKFRTAAELALLDDNDRALFREILRLNTRDLERVIPSVRIRQAWKQDD